MIDFQVAQDLKGYLTVRDLLNSQGTFSFVLTQNSIFSNDFLLFNLIDDSNLEKFIFTLSIQNQSLVMQRNDAVSILTLEDIPKEIQYLHFFVIWSYNEIKLICRFGSEESEQKMAKVKTNHSRPPNTLITWARKNNLLPTEEYNSEEEFRNKVHSCLQSIQDKINESDSFDQFWNIHYKGMKIIGREPKREVEVQPIIHSLLSDQFLMSSIEIIPEYNSSVGNLDFLFISRVKNIGFVYFCVEFKNAHSNKLLHGLEKQLPSYMKNKKSTYGAYCALDYRGEYFNQPQLKGDANLLFHLNLSAHDNIRNFTYNLSKPISSSRIK